MQRGQDWCLECGTAAPGRLGTRPGWRSAFTVVGLTTLLLTCAVVAAYAALTGDAERRAALPAAGSADPIIAQTPGTTAPGTPVPGTTAGAVPVQPGATGPGTTVPTQPPAGQPPAGQPPIVPAQPPPPATNTPVTPPPPPAAANNNSSGSTGSGGSTGAGSSSGSTANSGSTATSGATTTTPAVGLITFAKDAAKTYNQPERAGAEFGPARYAIDDKPTTVWDVVVPADGQPIAAGLVIDLGKPYALRSLRLATPTPGFTVEIYGARSAKELPTDVIDKRWIHLTDKKAVQDDGLIVLKGKGDGAKVQLLLLHMTAPADPTDPRVAIGDVVLRGTP